MAPSRVFMYVIATRCIVAMAILIRKRGPPDGGRHGYHCENAGVSVPRSLMYNRSIARRGMPKPYALAFALMFLVAACSQGGHSVAKTTSATTAPPGGNVTPLPTYPPSLHVKPVPGTYSVYVDPTFHYTVQYPVNWFVTPGIGQDESNVSFDEPVDPNDPNFPIHPVTVLIVRATTNYQETFVEHLLCNQYLGDSVKTAGGTFPAININTTGGDPKSGYTAPAFGRVFYAKGIAFEIWLQSSAKYYIDQFFSVYYPLWNHTIATFNPGPGAKPTAQC